MLAKKKKLTKKQIKEDSLVKTYYNAVKFYEKYQSKILMGLGAVAVIIVVIVLYSSKVMEDNRIATTQLSRVMPLYNSGSYLEAIDGRPGTNLVGLKNIVEDYGSTEQGEYAKVLLGNCYYFQDDFTMAMDYYNDYSGDNNLFKAAALAGMANCYEAQDNIGEAASYYKKAANVSETDPLTPEYLLDAGKCYLKLNEKEEARNLLSKIKTEYKNSSVSSEADKYLALVD